MAQKISVIITNYNGEKLLSKNLPTVIKNCSSCEIIVVDDASQDNSVSLIKKKFKNIKLVENKKNQGFARTANRGVKEAVGELILLLNSDVSPRKDFLTPAAKNFEDEKLFAVALLDFSHERNKTTTRGRGGATFKKGFVTHFKLESKSGETLWVSGGSGMFSKQKFLELGGFDGIFAPFYWEDIDLSFRAWQNGYHCLFEQNAKVDHFHEEGAIKKTSSEFLIKTSSYKNQFLFVWKNINDYYLIVQHIIWQPYHFIKALIVFDLAFFAGFLWALLKVPSLLFNYKSIQLHDSKLPEMEVLRKFEK